MNTEKAGKIGRGLKNNLIAILVASLLTVCIAVVGYSIGDQEGVKARLRESEKATALNADGIEDLCDQVEQVETTTIREIASLNRNINQRLESLERTVALILGAVTSNTKLQEDQ